jgi:glycosyltransferase involved in cell wall biosynthesis
VIAIDDGSTDRTPDILEGYASADERIVIIRQTNTGAGKASNTGIELARGEYLAFVDNDDWLEPTMYEKLHAALTSNGADMAVCNYNVVYDDRADACYSNMRNEAVNVHDDVYGYFCRYCACPRPNNYCWSRLYKSKIVKESGIRFENFSLGSDTLLNFKLLPLMKRVAFIKDGLYNYAQRHDSSVYTSAIRSNLATVYSDGFDSLADYYSSNGFDEFCSVLPIHAFTRLRSVLFYSRLAGLSDDAIAASILTGFKGRKIADYLSGAAI